jgi:hypothetical protein
MTMDRVALAMLLAMQLGCGEKRPEDNGARVVQQPFGTAGGKAVEVITLTNGRGMEVRVMTYGAIIVSLKAPDQNGTPGDVVLGYDSLEGYLRDSPYFGAVVGRYGNRIAKGRFALDGTEYKLAVNNGPNHLHGGLRGFDKVVWAAEPFEDSRPTSRSAGSSGPSSPPRPFSGTPRGRRWGWWVSPATSVRSAGWRTSSARRRRWKRWAGWPAGSPTTSTTC